MQRLVSFAVTGTSAMTDEDLITSWSLVVEGFTRTQDRVLRTIEETGVPGHWFEALHLLLRTESHRLPMSRLARDLSMTGGGLTKLADRMAREGLIDRRSAEADRRIVYAALTDKGIEVARTTARLYRGALREHVLGVLDPQRLAELTRLMRVLIEAHASAVPPTEEHIALPRDPSLPDRRVRDRSSV
jgi:DNA-binding MarR family transcriptional regulator